MKIGTKSVLFGAHCFIIHPFFVLAAWIKLYGFPYDPRLWIAFFVHDLGYWGKPNMDGPEGETHVELGAKVMGFLFDRNEISITIHRSGVKYNAPHMKGISRFFRIKNITLLKGTNGKWANFCRYHSRFYAKKDNQPYSMLCVADKLAVSLEPYWLYLPRVRWTGEIDEYMKLTEIRSLAGENKNEYELKKLKSKSQVDWFLAVKSYLKRWATEHQDGKDDSWTKVNRQSIDANGVFQ